MKIRICEKCFTYYLLCIEANITFSSDIGCRDLTFESVFLLSGFFKLSSYLDV